MKQFSTHIKRYFRKRYVLILLSCLFRHYGVALAQAGKSGWPIFRKAQAVNTRGTAAINTPESGLPGLYYNPASIAGKKRSEISIMSESGFIGDKLGGVIYGMPLKNGMIAGSLIGYDAGSMELNWMDNGNLMSENVTAQRDLMASVSYGHRYNQYLYLGGTLKAATTEIAQRASANAFAMDLGFMYRAKPNFYLSGALQNVGTSTKFIDKENPLPTSVYAGGGYVKKIKDSQVILGGGLTYNTVDETMVPETGVELRYGIVAMSAGYRFNVHESALQLGLGIIWHNVEFGYSYVPGVYLDTIHRLNMSYKF